MDEIFRRELKVDDSVADTSVSDEPDDFTLMSGQKKGETEQICDSLYFVFSLNITVYAR